MVRVAQALKPRNTRPRPPEGRTRQRAKHAPSAGARPNALNLKELKSDKTELISAIK
jgi:hypothetical protein